MKYFLFIFSGTFLVYSTTFHWKPWKGWSEAFPSFAAQMKLRQENELLHHELKKQRAEVEDLKFALERSQARGNLDHSVGERAIASLPSTEFHFNPKRIDGTNVVVDFVQQDTYQWSPKKLTLYFQKHWKSKQYLESAQFGLTLFYQPQGVNEFTEEELFQLGVAAIESQTYLQEGIQVLSNYISHYPRAKYFVRAKLWVALAHYKLGETRAFQSSLEEFKDKYRNTEEWRILSSLYQKQDQGAIHE